MKFALFLILLVPAFALETIICNKINSELRCYTYGGQDYDTYDYPKTYQERVISYHGSDFEGGDEYSDEYREPAYKDEINTPQTPVSIPYSPQWWDFYLKQ